MFHTFSLIYTYFAHFKIFFTHFGGYQTWNLNSTDYSIWKIKGQTSYIFGNKVWTCAYHLGWFIFPTWHMLSLTIQIQTRPFSCQSHQPILLQERPADVRHQCRKMIALLLIGLLKSVCLWFMSPKYKLTIMSYFYTTYFVRNMECNWCEKYSTLIVSEVKRTIVRDGSLLIHEWKWVLVAIDTFSCLHFMPH